MIRVLERGDIFFLYLPVAGVRHVRGLADVARTFFILSAEPPRIHRARHEAWQHNRLFSIHGLRLPAGQAGDRAGAWVLLERVAPRLQTIEDLLEPAERRAVVGKEIALVRPAGEGRYALVDRGECQELAYVLELPEQPGDVQRALNIASRAAYVVQVKAPDAPSPIPTEERPAYPAALRDLLTSWDLAPLLDPAVLDYPMTQLYLTPASIDVVDAIGLRPDREFNTTAETFRRLRLEAHLHPTDPLFTGDWA